MSVAIRPGIAADVYGLIDPRTDLVRYVGVTTLGVKHRLRQHIMYAKRGAKSHSARWIRQLLAENLRPEVMIIEPEVMDWVSAEKYWIAKIPNLTNMTPGGDASTAGIRGAMKHTEEHKEKIRRLQTGRSAWWAKKTEEEKHQTKIARLARKKERRRALIASMYKPIHKKKFFSLETRKKLSESRRAWLATLTPEQIRKRNLRPRDPITGKLVKKAL